MTPEEKKMEKTLEHIRKLFPEAEQISDIDLRQKVYKAWLTVWEMSGCDSPQAISFLPGILPEIDNVAHTKAVIAMSIQFANVMKEFHNVQVNMNHMIAGAILHDLGKYFRSSPTSADVGNLLGHAFSAAYIAIKEDLPLEVVHIISAHSAEGDLIKRTTEAAIVHYMDQAYAEVILRAKTNINREEFHKLRIFKQALRDEAKK
jgi:putative nucleotidyltransferase with HDIG domain